MGKDIHPGYHPVVFRGPSAGFAFLTRSAITGGKTIEREDGTHPLVDVDVSSAGHPFHIGRARMLDTAGRAERFDQRHGTT